MKSLVFAFASALILTLFPPQATLAGTKPTRVAYTFNADASYQTDSGCVQSVLSAAQVGSVLLVMRSTGDDARSIRLAPSQIQGFKKLGSRDLGEELSVTVVSNGVKLKFRGATCGKMLCDSLEITEGDGEPKTYDQPIHGLSKIGCDR